MRISALRTGVEHPRAKAQFDLNAPDGQVPRGAAMSAPAGGSWARRLARVAVPTHHDMFAANRGDPLAFVAAAARHDGLAALVPAHFAPVVLG